MKRHVLPCKWRGACVDSKTDSFDIFYYIVYNSYLPQRTYTSLWWVVKVSIVQMAGLLTEVCFSCIVDFFGAWDPPPSALFRAEPSEHREAEAVHRSGGDVYRQVGALDILLPCRTWSMGTESHKASLRRVFFIEPYRINLRLIINCQLIGFLPADW